MSEPCIRCKQYLADELDSLDEAYKLRDHLRRENAGLQLDRRCYDAEDGRHFWNRESREPL